MPSARAGVSRLWEALVRSLRRAWPALAGYAAVRVFGLLVFAAFAQRAGQPVLGLLGRHDGIHYRDIAEDGYDTGIRYDEGRLVNTNIAFFPLFPWLIRAATLLGIPSDVGGVLIATGFGLVAAWGMFEIGALVRDRSTGVLLAVLWGVLPHAIVENRLYTESLFTALVAWALWAVLRRFWLLAGGLTVLAGLTRPTAAALIGAIVLAVAMAAFRRQASWRAWTAVGVAPVGLLGFLAWCAIALGRPDAYFWMQREGWNNHTDFGLETLHHIGRAAVEERPLAVYITTAVIVVGLVLVVLLAADRTIPLPLVAFAVLLLLMVLLQGGGYYHAKARLLLPDFPLLLPVAIALSRGRPLARYLVLGTLAAFSAWYGSYLSLIWPWSP